MTNQEAADLRARAEQILTRIKAAKLANPNPSPVVRTSKPTGSGDGFIDCMNTLNDIATK